MKKIWGLTLSLLVALAVLGGRVDAQSLFSGDIAGVITDPSSAVVPDATVTLTSTDTGATQITSTNESGAYRFTLLKPGHFTVSVTHERLSEDGARGRSGGRPGGNRRSDVWK